MLPKVLRKLALVAISLPFIAQANAHEITGAGASFPYPIYAKWAGLYQQQTGNKVNYQSIGSGGGQQQIIAKTIDFGCQYSGNQSRRIKTVR